MASAAAARTPPLDIQPLTPDRWDELEVLFGKQGAYSGCWCTWWRLAGAAFERHASQERRAYFAEVVQAGPAPGLLAYRDGQPVGWCALAPRADFPRLAKSRYWQPLDDQPVWSINCFYVARGQRGQGVARALLRGAIAYATAQGARIIESYPRETDGPLAPSSAYTGSATMFRAVGFAEVARRHPERPLMRLELLTSHDE